MKPRIKHYTLCSHTTPDGKSHAGEELKLKKKFEKGTITKDELWAYCLLLHSSKKPDFTVDGEVSFDVPKSKDMFKTIKVWGKDIQITVEEHKIHCAHLKWK